jgi:hypothetical protein
MKTIHWLTAVLGIAATAAPALAFDDMMGTMVNGRVESRNERGARVQDPEMDRELRIIDREQRQGRTLVDPENPDLPSRQRQPYEGPLPN